MLLGQHQGQRLGQGHAWHGIVGHQGPWCKLPITPLGERMTDHPRDQMGASGSVTSMKKEENRPWD